MEKKKRATVSWSGGKDSAFALYMILLSGEYEIVHLHTVIDETTRRVGLHGVHEELIEQQAAAIHIPLIKIPLKASADHDEYSRTMQTFYQQCAREGIQYIVFGDIFLEDLREYREGLLKKSKLIPLFPLWKIQSDVLIADFLNTGFKTVICAANASYFTKEQMGQVLEEGLLKTFHPAVDCCGENGEFHTWVFDGPIFKKPVPFECGDIVIKTYTYQQQHTDGTLKDLQTDFWFQDLLPA